MTWQALSMSPYIPATFYEFKRPHASSAAHVAEVDASDPDQVEAAAAAAEEAAAVAAAEAEAERAAVYPVKTLAYIGGGDGSFELTVGGVAAGKVYVCSMVGAYTGPCFS
jgi:hypothetical protein